MTNLCGEGSWFGRDGWLSCMGGRRKTGPGVFGGGECEERIEN